MKLHSIESLGAVDGPGMRCVIFLQGCPLRCLYCHNPDARDFSDGRDVTMAEIRRHLLWSRPYFGPEHSPDSARPTGGVTISGGEPLASPAATAELLDMCREECIHSAVDTAGGFRIGLEQEGLSAAAKADMLLLDVKHPDAEACRRLTGRGPEGALTLLDQAERIGQRVWVRHVVVPGWSDVRTVSLLADLLRPYECVQKVELSGFHRLGREKYAAMGVPYPMGDTPGLPGRWLMSRDGSVERVDGTAELPG